MSNGLYVHVFRTKIKKVESLPIDEIDMRVVFVVRPISV